MGGACPDHRALSHGVNGRPRFHFRFRWRFHNLISRCEAPLVLCFPLDWNSFQVEVAQSPWDEASLPIGPVDQALAIDGVDSPAVVRWGVPLFLWTRLFLRWHCEARHAPSHIPDMCGKAPF